MAGNQANPKTWLMHHNSSPADGILILALETQCVPFAMYPGNRLPAISADGRPFTAVPQLDIEERQWRDARRQRKTTASRAAAEASQVL